MGWQGNLCNRSCLQNGVQRIVYNLGQYVPVQWMCSLFNYYDVSRNDQIIKWKTMWEKVLIRWGSAVILTMAVRGTWWAYKQAKCDLYWTKWLDAFCSSLLLGKTYLFFLSLFFSVRPFQSNLKLIALLSKRSVEMGMCVWRGVPSLLILLKGTVGWEVCWT